MGSQELRLSGGEIQVEGDDRAVASLGDAGI